MLARSLLPANHFSQQARKDRSPFCGRRRGCYAWREYVLAGGLMSYGTDLSESYREAAILCRQDSQGREACRFAREAAAQISPGSQSHRAADAPRPRRRGDRREPLTEVLATRNA